MGIRFCAAILFMILSPSCSLRLQMSRASTAFDKGTKKDATLFQEKGKERSMILVGEVPQAGIASTDAWVDSVLTQHCTKFAKMKTQPAKRAFDRLQFHETPVSAGVTDKTGLASISRKTLPCSQRPQACDDAKKLLTSAKCYDAAGFNRAGHADLNYFGSEQVCVFNRLYNSGRGKGDNFMVAHVVSDLDPGFPEEKVNRIRHASSVQAGFHSPVYVQHHKTLEEFADYLEEAKGKKGATKDVTTHEELVLALVPNGYSNIGHALYDTMYPAFVSLLQLGLHKENFHLLFMNDEAHVNAPEKYEEQKAIMATIGGHQPVANQPPGTAVMQLENLEGLHRFDKVVIGQGSNSAEMDINVNFTLGAARSMDAARLFRHRVFESFGLAAPVRRDRSDEGRENGKALQALFVNGGRGGLDPSQQGVVRQIAEANGVKVEFTEWYHNLPTDLSKVAADGVEIFREQLRKISHADIHVSAPGTTMLYQQFLQDGSVVVNMGSEMKGCRNNDNFMDEYITEGAPHVRAIHALRASEERYNESDVAGLIISAKKLIQQGFSIPTAPGANLSPYAAMTKAYAHLSVGDCNTPVDPHMPLRGYVYEFSDAGLLPGAEITSKFSKRQSPKDVDYPQHMQLWESLRQDFNEWAHFDWFQSQGSVGCS